MSTPAGSGLGCPSTVSRPAARPRGSPRASRRAGRAPGCGASAALVPAQHAEQPAHLAERPRARRLTRCDRDPRAAPGRGRGAARRAWPASPSRSSRARPRRAAPARSAALVRGRRAMPAPRDPPRPRTARSRSSATSRRLVRRYIPVTHGSRTSRRRNGIAPRGSLMSLFVGSSACSTARKTTSPTMRRTDAPRAMGADGVDGDGEREHLAEALRGCRRGQPETAQQPWPTRRTPTG